MTNTTIAKDLIEQTISRIERLEKEKRDIADAIKDIYAEAKGNGLQVKPLREVIKLRRLSAQERKEQSYLLDSYMVALGMAPSFERE